MDPLRAVLASRVTGSSGGLSEEDNSSFPWRYLNNRLALMPFSSTSFDIDTPGLQEATTSYCLNSEG